MNTTCCSKTARSCVLRAKAPSGACAGCTIKPRPARSKDFVEPPGRDVEDEAAYAVVVQQMRIGLDACDAGAHVGSQIVECVERIRRFESGFGGNLGA